MQRSLQLNKDMLMDQKLMPVALGQAIADMVATLFPFLLLLFIAMLIIGGMPGGYIFLLSYLVRVLTN